MRRGAAIAAAMLVMVSACSGDDDAATTTVTVDATTATAPPETAATTDPPPETSPTTDPPSTSEPPATTDPPTTAPPTTDPPPTTVDPLVDLAASVQRDAQAGEDTLVEVLEDPSSSDAEDRLSVYFGGNALDAVLSALAQFREDDLIVAPHPDVPSTLLVTSEPRLFEESDPPRVEVETCRLDSAIVLGADTETGIRVPIDDEIYRTDALSTFLLVDGTWRLEGGETTYESVGDRTCD